MKLAVIGSRGINDHVYIEKALSELRSRIRFTAIVSGGARGVDEIAEGWAKDSGIETIVYKPDYKTYAGNIAPLIRNDQIVDECDLLIAFWDGVSRGTRYTMDRAKAANKLLRIYRKSKLTGGWL